MGARPSTTKKPLMEQGRLDGMKSGLPAAEEPGLSAATESWPSVAGKAAAIKPPRSSVTKAVAKPGESDRDWMNREMKKEAIDFREKFEKVICEDIFENVENFMANSYEHPRFVWLDLLLSSPSKNKAGADNVHVLFASLMWTRLEHYFPDVLHRELFLDVFHWVFSDEKIADRFGPLHGAVLCGRPEIVRLLSDHRKNAQVVGKGICRPIREHLDGHRKSGLGDCFDIIKRAILWSHLPGLWTPLPKLWSDLEKPSVYEEVAAFMEKFKNAKESKEMESFICTAFPKDFGGRLIRKRWNFQVWVVILAWANAFERLRGDIVEKFRDSRPELFTALTDRQPWKKFFSGSLERTATKNETTHEGKETTHEGKETTGTKRELDEPERSMDTVVKIVEQMMTYVQDTDEGTGTLDDIRMQLCSLYNLSYRVPHARKSCWTAVHLAAALGDHSVMDTLIECYDLVIRTIPVTFEIKLTGTSSPLGIHGFLGQSLFDTFKLTPLHHAALGNHHRVMKSLLEWRFFCSHVNALDFFKRTAFQIACGKSEQVPAVVKELLSSQELDVNTRDCCGFTPLHWAVYVGATEVVRVLMDEKKKVIRSTVRSADGQHPHRVAESLNAEIKRDIQELLMCNAEVKDGVERLYRDRQVYVDAANAILVGAALIASVTFGGWLQPPLGDRDDLTDTSVRVFWAFSSLSFFFAVGTVMAGAGAVLPVADLYIEDAVEDLRNWLVGTAFVFIFSIVFVLGAFAAAGFASLSLVPHLKANMISTTSIGSVLCCGIGILFFYRLFRIKRGWYVIFSAFRSSKKGVAQSSDTSSFLKRVWDLCRAPLRKSHRTQGSDSLTSVLSPVEIEADEPDHGKLAEKLAKIQHLQSGDPLCPYRRHKKTLDFLSKIRDMWPNENFLPENTAMWKNIAGKVQVSRTANPQPHRSFLFHHESEFILPSGTIQDESGQYGLASGMSGQYEDETTLPSGTIQGESSVSSGPSQDGAAQPSGMIQDERLERFGIVKVGNLPKDLFGRRLESLNRQALKLSENRQALKLSETKVVMKVPFCCEGCEEKIVAVLIEMKGVHSVEYDRDKEKVILVVTTAAPADILLECRKYIRKSRMWSAGD